MGENRSPNVQSVHENQRLRERKGQSHQLNKSKPVQRGQTMCGKRQYFQTPSCERPLQKRAWHSALLNVKTFNLILCKRKAEAAQSSACVVIIDQFSFRFDIVMKRKKTLHPFCFYNRDHTGAKLSLHLPCFRLQRYFLLPLLNLISSCIISKEEGRKRI